MRRLIIVNTYYQLIFASQLRNTLFEKDYVALVITDQSKGTELVADKLAKTGFFSEVCYKHTDIDICKRNAAQRIQDYFEISFCKQNRYSGFLDDMRSRFYDELLVYNYTIETYGVYSALCIENPDIKVSMFEEGILSYNSIELDNAKRFIINASRRVLGKPVITSALCYFYCFFPGLYSGKLKPMEVEKIDKTSEVVSVLAEVFNVNKNNHYSEKYIFFASVYDFEGGEPIGEYEVVKRLSDYLGRENLIVKVHPRDTRTIYKNMGLKIDSRSEVPWEIILLCGDFSDKILLTVNSTSVLSSCLLSDDNIRGFYLYKMCDINNNALAKKIVSTIDRLINVDLVSYNNSSVKIISKVEDIQKV